MMRKLNMKKQRAEKPSDLTDQCIDFVETGDEQDHHSISSISCEEKLDDGLNQLTETVNKNEDPVCSEKDFHDDKKKSSTSRTVDELECIMKFIDSDEQEDEQIPAKEPECIMRFIDPDEQEDEQIPAKEPECIMRFIDPEEQEDEQITAKEPECIMRFIDPDEQIPAKKPECIMRFVDHEEQKSDRRDLSCTEKPYVDLAEIEDKRSESKVLSENGFNEKIRDESFKDIEYCRDVSNTYFHAELVRVIFDGNGKHIMNRVRAVQDTGVDLGYRDISSRQYQDKLWIHEKFGLQCRVGPHPQAYDVITSKLSDDFRNVDTQYVFKEFGWAKWKGMPFFAVNGESIGLYSDEVVCEVNSRIERDLELDELELFYNACDMLNVTHDLRISLTMFTFMIAAVMRSIFESANIIPRFVLWIVGETSSYKTSLGKLYFNLADRSDDQIMASFRDTANAIGVLAGMKKDQVLHLDDFFPANSAIIASQLRHTADNTIRLYADNIARSRLGKNFNLTKDDRPTGLCAVTAEDRYSGTSTKARCLNLEISKDQVDLEVLTRHQNSLIWYSTFFYRFIEYLAENYNAIVGDLKSDFIQIRMDNQDISKHGRLVETYSILVLSFRQFLKYGLEIGAIDKKIFERKYLESEVIFRQLVKDMNAEIYSGDVGRMYAYAISELVNSRTIHLSSPEKVIPDSFGVEDYDYLFFHPGKLYREVIQYYKAQNISFTASKVKAHAALDALALGLIIKDGSKRTVKKSFSDYKRLRYLAVNKEKLMEVLQEE